ncbi:Glycosyltransferase family 64 protein C4 [Choanephora cucurbitarum]|uniref:Glycosyltransferase family 64 protein C4 n=1 Tax=Choanephora cucurbitarum TaxID=101091 RepID=A0A1C7N6N7_9FUNG|nr:Glycosyltransferase family 64 protein C4 [Choanephora cucurbitarum]
MLEPIWTSLYSLQNKKPFKPDTVVLISDTIELEKDEISTFDLLGTKLIRISPLEFPGNQQIPFNRNSIIIQLWAMLDYGKLIYFTPDVIFEDHVDQLFNHPAGTAFIANQNDGNSSISMLILEPNTQSFEAILKDYRRAGHNLDLIDLLQGKYLTPASYHASFKQMITLYTKLMKPWNFHLYRDTDWKKHIDPVLFYKWRHLNNQMHNTFNTTKAGLWENAERQHQVCSTYLNFRLQSVSSFPIEDQFSVLISTYNPDRIEHLSLLIKHLLKSSKIHTVYITWHNPALQVPNSLLQGIPTQDHTRVVILPQSFDSLNNRFNPIPGLQTDSVYIMDDDIFVGLEDLEFTFQAWQNRKDSIVGHFPRLHTYNHETNKATYRVVQKAPYSIILTKSMFIRSDYLFSYTCLLDPDLHQIIDDQLNCEDLAFAMMVAGMSHAPPGYVQTKVPIEDFGLVKGISTNSAHMPARAKCISDFVTQFWHQNDPLLLAYDTTISFSRTQYRRGSWQRVKKTIQKEESG